MQPIGLPSPMSASAPTSRISVVAPVSLLAPPVDSSAVVELEKAGSSVVVPRPSLVEAGAVRLTTVVVNGDVSACCS